MSSSRNAKSFQIVESMWWFISSRVLRGQTIAVCGMILPQVEYSAQGEAD
jgi:hypothetical protein